MRSLQILAAALLVAIAAADGTYKSRPDLSPPRLNITVPCTSACEQGYLFVAPFSGYTDELAHGPAQPGPYILAHDGSGLVWSGFGYLGGWSANFQAARWRGADVLFAFEGRHNGPHGHGHGHHTLLSRRYETVRELRAGGHRVSDKHEFIIVDDTTALIQIYEPVQLDLTPYGGNEEQLWIVNAIFQELDIASGEVLFEWSSLDHVSPNDTMLTLASGLAGVGRNSSTAWDYFHINSVAKGDDGNYLVSARHASTIFKIDGRDGSIIWRLGGHRSDFSLGPGVKFGFQHHARHLTGGSATLELISLFDNSVYGSESAGGERNEVRLYPYSRGKYISLDHAARTATLVRAFHPPGDGILTKSQGSLQTLPNGNVLINWGSEGQVTEYTADGVIVFHAHLDSGALGDNVQNYRAFRYNWTGISPEAPAVYAERDGAQTRVYVSWNGDTETVNWRFVWVMASKHGLGEQRVVEKDVPRTGFETVLAIDNAEVSTISAEALDEWGRILARSSFVAVKPAVGTRFGKDSRVAPVSTHRGDRRQGYLEMQELR